MLFVGPHLAWHSSPLQQMERQLHSSPKLLYLNSTTRTKWLPSWQGARVAWLIPHLFRFLRKFHSFLHPLFHSSPGILSSTLTPSCKIDRLNLHLFAQFINRASAVKAVVLRPFFTQIPTSSLSATMSVFHCPPRFITVISHAQGLTWRSHSSPQFALSYCVSSLFLLARSFFTIFYASSIRSVCRVRCHTSLSRLNFFRLSWI